MNLPDGRQQQPVKRILRVVLATLGLTSLIFLAHPGATFAWGPTAHRAVNNWAVETLPPEIRSFFEANRQFLVEHANDPLKWIETDPYERKRHYMYLDKYGVFPYLELPHNFNQAKQRYGLRRINRDGLLPWHVGEYSLRLTNALKEENWEEAKLAAAALGHYVADTRNPLHTTSNYDGQESRQLGLEVRFGTQLVDRFQGFIMFRPPAAVKIDDPTEYAFDAVLDSNTWVNRIILADRRAVVGLRDYNEDFYDRFYAAVGTIVARELNRAAHDVGSYWYTAWLNAGRPQLPAR